MPQFDVIYQGLELAKAASLRAEETGGFLELAAPMPVGTQLELHGEEGVRGVRVEHVREGADAGVQVRFVERKADAQGEGSPDGHAAREADAPIPVDAEKTVLDDESDKNASGRHRRRKAKKTILGR